MSWSIRLVGKPENLVKALEAESAKLTGQCKVEFDAAMPHLVGLVQQNYVTPEGLTKGYHGGGLLRLEANGSGGTQNGQDMHRSCSAKIEYFSETLV